MQGRWLVLGNGVGGEPGRGWVLQALYVSAPPSSLFIAQVVQLLCPSPLSFFTEAGGGAGKVFKSIHPSTLGTFVS